MNLADARRANGLTQKELADLAQINVSQVQKLEYGRSLESASAATVLKIAKALCMTVEELLA